MDAQAQDRCHRIGQTRDVHIYRLISERTVEENILKKANQKRMLGDMAIEGGNFTTAYFKQQTIRELFDMPLDEPAKKEGEFPAVAQEDEEETMATKQTQILEQALCKAEDPEDIRAATQAKAEQVAELAEFNENIPLDSEDRPSKEEEEEMSKAEQEIASLVEQLTPIERYAMNFLEASLEDISREELKQAEEQVEAARKDIDQAKDEVVFKLPEDEDENCLLEETSSKKSKKAKTANRGAPERTGTRMSERLRSSRLPPREGDSGDSESTQARLSSLRHPRVATDEDDDTLPQVAQHTRGAAVRRELEREEKLVLNTRRAVPRREEPWTKVSAAGERGQKAASQKIEASPSGDRVLRTNPHKVETLVAGSKLFPVTLQKMDEGAAGDRVLKGSPPKAEAQPTGKLLEGPPQITDSSLNKAPKLGPQESEKSPCLDKLQPSSSTPEALVLKTQISQIQPQELDVEGTKLKADMNMQKQKEMPQLNSSVPEFHTPENISNTELLEPQAPVDVAKTSLEILAIEEMAPNLVLPITTPELYCENKPDAACESDIPSNEQKETLPRPEKEVDMTASYDALDQESQNSVDEAPRMEAALEVTPPDDDDDRKVPDPPPIESPKEAADGSMPTFESEIPKIEVPVSPSFDHSMTAASSHLHVETLPCVKEQNGLEQLPKTKELPFPVSDFAEVPHPEIALVETALLTTDQASRSSSSLMESPKQGQGVVEKSFHEDEQPIKEAEITTISPGAVSVHESSSASGICPGTTSSDDSLSPIKIRRRRTSADVQIRQSYQDQDSPTAKVLRKLPGRLVTVVEEKELVRRRRHRVHELDASDSSMMSPSNSSAQSGSEPETSSSGKELPLLRDLPARRRIEMESRAAAKERDGISRGELFASPSTEPVKRKRGRPPKNKSAESPISLPPLLEPTLEVSSQNKTPKQTVLETESQRKSSEQMTPETQLQIKTSESSIPQTHPQSDIAERKVTEFQLQNNPEQKISEIQLQGKTSEQKLPGIQPQIKTSKKVSKSHNKTSEQKLSKTQPRNKDSEQKLHKTGRQKAKSPKDKRSSPNDSPVEKKRRGRPPKLQESPVVSPKTSASKTLPATAAKPDLSPKVKKQLKKSCRSTAVTEATSEIHKSVNPAPKTTLVSKTPSKARNRKSMHPKSMSQSKPISLELLASPLKSLSKSPTEMCETLAPLPSVVSAVETSTEMEEKLPLLPQPHMASEASQLLDSPPKRKRGRPPKNTPPRLEAGPPSASTSGQKISPKIEKLADPACKRRRRKRNDELGPSLSSPSQSSLEDEDNRRLTRLSRLKRDEKPEPSSAQSSPKNVVIEGASSSESSTWEQVPSETPGRSTRLRPGSLVPPLEWEIHRRKRRYSLGSSQVSDRSKSPAPQASSDQEGRESESSPESNSNNGNRQSKRQCCEAGVHGRKRAQKQHPRGGSADRVLRSAAKPADTTSLAPSPVPTRRAGASSAAAASAVGVPGVISSSGTPSPVTPVTSSLSNRGRKPKT